MPLLHSSASFSCTHCAQTGLFTLVSEKPLYQSQFIYSRNGKMLQKVIKYAQYHTHKKGTGSQTPLLPSSPWQLLIFSSASNPIPFPCCFLQTFLFVTFKPPMEIQTVIYLKSPAPLDTLLPTLSGHWHCTHCSLAETVLVRVPFWNTPGLAGMACLIQALFLRLIKIPALLGRMFSLLCKIMPAWYHFAWHYWRTNWWILQALHDWDYYTSFWGLTDPSTVLLTHKTWVWRFTLAEKFSLKHRIQASSTYLEGGLRTSHVAATFWFSTFGGKTPLLHLATFQTIPWTTCL